MPVLLNTKVGIVQVSSEVAQSIFVKRMQDIAIAEHLGRVNLNWRNDPLYNAAEGKRNVQQKNKA